MLGDILLILFLLGGALTAVMILKEMFGPSPVKNRYAVPGDRTIKRDPWGSRRQLTINQIALLVMIFAAMIGAVLYLLR
jgi:hypothetical protein